MKKLVLLIVLLVSIALTACAPRNQIKPGDSNATKASKVTNSLLGWF